MLERQLSGAQAARVFANAAVEQRNTCHPRGQLHEHRSALRAAFPQTPPGNASTEAALLIPLRQAWVMPSWKVFKQFETLL